MNDFNKNDNTIFGESLTTAQITQIIVTKYANSPMIKSIMEADEYYNGHNLEIEKKSVVYYDKDRKKIDNPKASNKKLNSQFLRNLVQQKQDYGFAKTFVIKVSTDTESEVDLKTNAYGKKWKDFCDGQLFELSYELAGKAVNHGKAWCYVWIDENGEFKLKSVPANFVFPIWKDRNHEKIDKIVYNYTTEKYDSLNPKITEYAEYWDDNKRELFSITDGYAKVPITLDNEGNSIDTHLYNSKGEGVSWGRIPFVCLKGTSDERTLLSFIKRHIDCYDELDSLSADELADHIDPLLVFKGISPDVNDLVEARELAKMTKTISLDTDGDAKYITVDSEIDSYQKKMESLRRDIIKFGYGVDYEDLRFNGNPNQMVIQSLYQGLDGYMDGLERHFQNFVNNVKYFFDKWWEMTGEGTFEEAQKYKVLIKLDRTMMINSSQLIQDAKILKETGVSRRTQLEFNPIVQDVDVEEERIKEEEEELRKSQDLYATGFDDFNDSDSDNKDLNSNKKKKNSIKEDEKNG